VLEMRQKTSPPPLSTGPLTVVYGERSQNCSESFRRVWQRLRCHCNLRRGDELAPAVVTFRGPVFVVYTLTLSVFPFQYLDQHALLHNGQDGSSQAAYRPGK
jgi:hypothetical protein